MHSTTSDNAAHQSEAEWLAHIGSLMGAEAAGMLVLRADTPPRLVTCGHTDDAINQYKDYFCTLDPLTSLLAQRPAGRALVIDTRSHPSYLAQHELCADYLRPHGIDHVIATCWTEPDGTQRYVGVQRFHGSAPFEARDGNEFDSLIRHWRVSQALPPMPGFQAEGGTSRRNADIAAQLPHPLAVVDSRLAVIWANPAARCHESTVWVALFKARDRDPGQSSVRRQLGELVLASLRQHSELDSLITTTDLRWIATACPLIGKPGLALLRMTALETTSRGLRSRLERLFGLTRAEAELSVQLTEGKTLEVIASGRNVSVETVRTQLRATFKKAGIHRQSELVCLVSRMNT